MRLTLSFLAACMLLGACAGRERADEERTELKAHDDHRHFAPGLAQLLGEWRATSDRVGSPDYRTELVVDLAARRVMLEGLPSDHAQVPAVPLPEGYEWSAYRVFPGGHQVLGPRFRLRLRAPVGQRNACPEIIHVQGKLGPVAGIFFHIEERRAGSGTGVAIVDSYTFGELSGVVNESLLVRDGP